MSKRIVLLIAILIIIFGIVYVAYDIYKAVSPETLCTDKCSKAGCDNRTAFNCTKDRMTGCRYKENLEAEIGVCGVQCLTMDDCNESLKCTNNECVKPSCGDEKCDNEEGENCATCVIDCPVDSGSRCCYGKIVDGECCSISDCNELEHEICEENMCVVGPFCGDGKCDKEEENCETCKKDCRPTESQVCCSGGVIEDGECCRDSQCDEDAGEECRKHECVVVSSS